MNTTLLKNKKVMIGLAIGALVLLMVGGGIFAYTRNGKATTETVAASPAPKKRRTSVPVNVIPVAERPYQRLQPLDSRNIQVEVVSTNKAASEAEYELEYQAGSLLQGAFGALKLDQLPATAKILFGSCSAGGACTYHTDISGGTLLTRFSGGEEAYAVKTSWKYYEGKNLTGSLKSEDGLFTLTSPSTKSLGIAVVYTSPGYPAGLTGTPVSEAYAVTATGKLTGSAQISIEATEAGSLSLMGWNGSAWSEVGTANGSQTISASGELQQLYVVVKK